MMFRSLSMVIWKSLWKRHLNAWTGTLEKVFPTVAVDGKEEVKTDVFKADSIYVCKNKDGKAYRIYSGIPGNQL